MCYAVRSFIHVAIDDDGLSNTVQFHSGNGSTDVLTTHDSRVKPYFSLEDRCREDSEDICPTGQVSRNGKGFLHQHEWHKHAEIDVLECPVLK